jgi:hypothetical protein
VIVGVSAFFLPNSLGVYYAPGPCSWDCAWCACDMQHVSARRLLGLVNQCVLPIAPDEVALSPLVPLASHRSLRRPWCVLTPVVGGSGEYC